MVTRRRRAILVNRGEKKDVRVSNQHNRLVSDWVKVLCLITVALGRDWSYKLPVHMLSDCLFLLPNV